MLLDSPIGLGLLFLFGILTGTLAGLLGIGGGVLLVPALIFAGAQTTVQATATSLIGVFLSATSGSLRNLRAGTLNWRASLSIAVFGVFAAQQGAVLGEKVPDTWLSLGFAALLLITIYLIGLKKQLQRRNQQVSEEEGDRPTRSLATTENVEVDTASDRPSALSHVSAPTHHWTSPIKRLLPSAGIGVMAGLLSGLFGVGGGVVMVPLQMLILGEEIKAAVQTSLGAIVAIAASGLLEHTRNDNVLWVPGLALGIGGIIGAQFGTRLLPKLSDRTVSIMFRLLLISLSVYMIIRALQS
ncbi:MAG: sulfite exporter TauE/SafE family protein [Leptolyngbyaceae bacterium]|nr:sulfite exporter TauE/SafE family protein [Leptolyngbyaceae bacterium]